MTVPSPSPSPSPAIATAPIQTRDALPLPAAATVGAFGPVIPWHVIPLHIAMLPDGRLMSYGTKQDGTQTGRFNYDVWRPGDGTGIGAHDDLPQSTGTDLFCSSQMMLQNGEMLLQNGDIYNPAWGQSSNIGNADVNIFSPATNTIRRAGTMNRPRWYGTPTTLPDGRIYIQGGTGGNDRAEIREADGSYRLLTGFFTNDLGELYPRAWVAPNGRLFGLAYSAMYQIDVSGNGTRTNLGNINSHLPSGRQTAPDDSSSAVMYRPGRIFQVGGMDNRAVIVDINATSPSGVVAPTITDAGDTIARRTWASATVMADGRVAVSAGSEIKNFSGIAPATPTAPVYDMQIWNPDGGPGGSWMTGPQAQRMRLYHNVQILLPDGSVLTAGGGAPGPQVNTNGEIYYPPYLFQPNGQLAVRPRITAAPTVAEPTSQFILVSPDAATIQKIHLIGMGTVTHSFDMNQRFVPLAFNRDGDQLTVQLPSNRFETPPGYYLVFALNGNGTPSIARIIRINPA
ncbi:MAG: galactose oxidase-like domain-containing protein [Lautropia sp.]